MTTRQPSAEIRFAETSAFLDYLRERPASRGLADAIVEVFALRGCPVLLPARVEDTPRRVAS